MHSSAAPQCFDDAVRPHLARVFVEDAQAGLDAGADAQRRDLEVAPEDLLEDGGEGRDDAGVDVMADLAARDAVQGEEVSDRHGVLVRLARRVSGDAAGGAQRLLVEDAERHVGVAYVHGQ